MYRALGLLLFATEGALAQSREPSDWDDNVPGYSSQAINWTTAAGGLVTCPCTGQDCHPAITATLVQTGASTLQVTWASKPAVKFAYLTDQDGTIIDYKDGGWNNGRIMTFSWASSTQPTRFVPHIVYEDSCAVSTDVFPTKDKQSWRTKMALLSEEYDVGNSPSKGTTDDGAASSPFFTESCTPGTPCVPDGTPTIAASDINLAGDWFNNGGSAEATFPTDGVGGADDNAAWLTTQDGAIIYYAEGNPSNPIPMGVKPFPRGTVELHACRLFKTKKLCATASLVDKYIYAIDNFVPTPTNPTPTTSVGAYSETNTAFTDAFSGYFDKEAGRTSIGPKSGTCTQGFVIYAKKIDDGTNSLLAFAFDKAIHFAANITYEYKVTLTCDGTTSTTGTMDLAVFDAANTPEGTFADGAPSAEVVVGDKRCDADHADHDHAEGAEEAAAAHPPPSPAYPSSTLEDPKWFQHEGRDCICEQGTLKCKRSDAGSPFSMNEGETVGLVIAVSAIVFICIGAIFFFGYSAMLKRKQRETGVVLQSDGDRL